MQNPQLPGRQIFIPFIGPPELQISHQTRHMEEIRRHQIKHRHPNPPPHQELRCRHIFKRQRSRRKNHRQHNQGNLDDPHHQIDLHQLPLQRPQPERRRQTLPHAEPSQHRQQWSHAQHPAHHRPQHKQPQRSHNHQRKITHQIRLATHAQRPQNRLTPHPPHAQKPHHETPTQHHHPQSLQRYQRHRSSMQSAIGPSQHHRPTQRRHHHPPHQQQRHQPHGNLPNRRQQQRQRLGHSRRRTHRIHHRHPPQRLDIYRRSIQNLHRLMPQQQQRRNPIQPTPQHLQRRQRRPPPTLRQRMHKRLRAPHRPRSNNNSVFPQSLHYFTTRFTSLPGTTIVFTIVLPSIRAFTFSSVSAATFTVASSLPAGTFTTFTSFPFTCTGISISFSRASSSSATGHAVRNTTPSPPICSHISAAKNGANGASSRIKPRKTSAIVAGETSPASIAASFAIISFTRIMIDEIDVLKCQRPSKSCVIFAIVWCSLRNNA